MHTILIKNGLLVDPGSGTLREEDLLVKDGMIAGRGAYSGEMADRVIDASGLAVLPGLVDLHVHLRDPGQEYKEDVRTGALAAARGGVTSLFAMPNTAPPVDSVETYRYVTDKAAHVSPVRVYQSATLTLGMKNEALTDMRALAAAGVKGFTEDGKSVMNASLLRDAMILAKELGLPVMEHCEDITMVRGGVMNDDANAQRLGLPGISNAVEDVIVARDCILARETGAHLHLQHCSTAGSVRIVRAAKALGVDVSAEVCPHHFAMTSDEIPGDDANYKMNPPRGADLYGPGQDRAHFASADGGEDEQESRRDPGDPRGNARRGKPGGSRGIRFCEAVPDRSGAVRFQRKKYALRGKGSIRKLQIYHRRRPYHIRSRQMTVRSGPLSAPVKTGERSRV